MWLFTALVIGHVVAGTIALLSFWVPVITRKGSARHRLWGKVFATAVYSAAGLATVMGILNLTLLSDRHPTLLDRRLFAGLFGWMMIYLSLLSILFVSYGLGVIRHKANHAGNRNWRQMLLFVIVGAAAVQCGIAGVNLRQPLMIALAGLGLIAMITFARASLRPAADTKAYQREHLKAMLGGGISAYTAFLSVGLLRVVPEHVFNPLVWAVPSVIGVMLVIHNLRLINNSAAFPAHVRQ